MNAKSENIPQKIIWFNNLGLAGVPHQESQVQNHYLALWSTSLSIFSIRNSKSAIFIVTLQQKGRWTLSTKRDYNVFYLRKFSLQFLFSVSFFTLMTLSVRLGNLHSVHTLEYMIYLLQIIIKYKNDVKTSIITNWFLCYMCKNTNVLQLYQYLLKKLFH